MNKTSLILPLVCAATLAAGLSGCQREGILPGNVSSSAAKPSFTVGPIPPIVSWSKLPRIPYAGYTKTDTIAGTYYGIGFSINNIGFVLGQQTYSVRDEFEDTNALWMFDVTTQKWVKRASFPGGNLIEQSAFVIGDNAYVIVGTSVYRYNQPADKWYPMNTFPGPPRLLATAMSINGKGYLGLGDNTSTPYFNRLNDWWQYDPTSDHWTPAATFGGEARDQAGGFAIDGKGYVFMGSISSEIYLTTVWMYDPVANKWTQKQNFPGSARGGELAANVTIGGANVGMMAGGYNSNVGLADFWEYKPSTDSWVEIGSIPGGPRAQEACFALSNSFFMVDDGGVAYNWSK